MNKKIINFLFLSLLLLGANSARAQQGEESRPLRNVQTAEKLPVFDNTRAAPAPEPSLLAPAALQQELTQYYIAHYSSPGGIQWLNAVMERSGVYLPFIKE